MCMYPEKNQNRNGEGDLNPFVQQESTGRHVSHPNQYQHLQYGNPVHLNADATYSRMMAYNVVPLDGTMVALDYERSPLALAVVEANGSSGNILGMWMTCAYNGHLHSWGFTQED